MNKIKTFDDLVNTLMSVDVTGTFSIPLDSFLNNDQLTCVKDNLYCYKIDNDHMIRFTVIKNCIAVKIFFRPDGQSLLFDRDDDKPYFIEYSSSGIVTSMRWKKDNKNYRANNLLPINVDYKEKDGLLICSYAVSNKVLNVSYLIFNCKKNILIDFRLSINGKDISKAKAIEQFPFLSDLTKEDCLDLNRVFTSDMVTILEMMYI